MSAHLKDMIERAALVRAHAHAPQRAERAFGQATDDEFVPGGVEDQDCACPSGIISLA